MHIVITVTFQLDTHTHTETVYAYIHLFLNVMVNFKSVFYGSFGEKTPNYIYIISFKITKCMQQSPTEELTGPLLVKKFITTFTRATCPYPEPDQSSPCFPLPHPMC
jgi:hypothetical protein